MKTKNIIILLVLYCNTISFAQEKGMYLINKKSQDSTFLVENRRIKVFTLNGKSKAGKFKILDDKTISIKNDTLALSSIIKIRKASAFSAIASPVSIYFGAIFITGSLFLLTESGLGPILAAFTGPPGLVMFILPLTANMHKREKWQYAIVR
jgi:hypothetical protein